MRDRQRERERERGEKQKKDRKKKRYIVEDGASCDEAILGGKIWP